MEISLAGGAFPNDNLSGQPVVNGGQPTVAGSGLQTIPAGTPGLTIFKQEQTHEFT
jgi:hypothetical protein